MGCGDGHNYETFTVTTFVVSKKWEDWIDYWACDFDFESQPEYEEENPQQYVAVPSFLLGYP